MCKRNALVSHHCGCFIFPLHSAIPLCGHAKPTLSVQWSISHAGVCAETDAENRPQTFPDAETSACSFTETFTLVKRKIRRKKVQVFVISERFRIL